MKSFFSITKSCQRVQIVAPWISSGFITKSVLFWSKALSARPQRSMASPPLLAGNSNSHSYITQPWRQDRKQLPSGRNGGSKLSLLLSLSILALFVIVVGATTFTQRLTLKFRRLETRRRRQKRLRANQRPMLAKHGAGPGHDWLSLCCHPAAVVPCGPFCRSKNGPLRRQQHSADNREAWARARSLARVLLRSSSAHGRARALQSRELRNALLPLSPLKPAYNSNGAPKLTQLQTQWTLSSPRCDSALLLLLLAGC